MAKKVKKTEKKNAKTVLIVISAVLVVAIMAGAGYLIYNSNGVQYGKAVDMIEEGDFKGGYDRLIEIAEKNEDYKDTNELLYTRAIELIETGELKNKQAAYKMLDPISGYKNADEIMYFLWVEDVYDPKDDNSFEQADQFMAMIPEGYDGPFANEVERFRSDIKKSLEELNRKKYEAAMEAEAEMSEGENMFY